MFKHDINATIPSSKPLRLYFFTATQIVQVAGPI